MGGEWTSNDGYGCSIPVEIMYSKDGYLWQANYNIAKQSGASVTMFIENGANTTQGEFCVHVSGSASVILYELPAAGSSHASVPSGDATAINVYNINRKSAATNNLTKIRIGTNATWKNAVDATELYKLQCNTYLPYHSGHNGSYWVLNSSATYALSVISKSADNYINVTYIWDETSV